MPPEEWNRMEEEEKRAWDEYQEVQGRITESFSSSGLPDEGDLDRASALWERVQAIRKRKQDYLDRMFGR